MTVTSDELDRAVVALQAGSLIVMPTDTVYGVAAAAWMPSAVEKLFVVKGRESDKPIPLLAADQAAVMRAGALMDAGEQRLAEHFWPGPLTLVLRLARSKTTEGFRVPDCEVARDLLGRAGGVLRVTSANRSGQPAAVTAQEAKDALGDSVAMVLDAGRCEGGTASSVVQIQDNELVVHREGALTRDELVAVWRQG